MIREYLEKRNLSIYRLSEMSEVPYTTINELVNKKKQICDCKIKTIENIAKALNISIETLLNLLQGERKFISNSWENNRDKKFYFPIIVENENYECDRIHPLMQRKINDIYYYVSNDNLIEKVIIFGSSTNIRCNNKSDIDIAIKLKEERYNKDSQNFVSEKIQEITNFNSDIVWLNSLDENSKLFYEINFKGVVIYE